LFRLDSGNVYRAQPLEDIPWLEHGFGTRLSADWPGESGLVTLKQIHSDHVILAEHSGCLGEGDALITNVPGLTLSIRTADCLPILIADQRNRAIAAVHAGWRGTVSQVVPKTVQLMSEKFGTRSADLVVAIGPGIGGCCFEVGPEVASQFGPFFPERDDLHQRAKIDLVETTLRQLGRNDGTLGRFATSGNCSVCGAEQLLHSYRRDRERAGRMIAAIRIR
jgi:YfiH family protein